MHKDNFNVDKNINVLNSAVITAFYLYSHLAHIENRLGFLFVEILYSFYRCKILNIRVKINH